MRKTVLFVSAIAALCLLCSCSLFHRADGTDPSDTSSQQDAAEERLNAVINGAVDLDSLSYDELLSLYDEFLKDGNDALNDGAENDLLYRDADIKSGDATAELSYELPANAQTAVFSDDPWEDKTVESLDPTANMSAEDRAEYEAFIKEMENFDAAQFQSGIDEMLMGTPGFEDYDPEAQETGDGPSMLDEWPDNDLTKQIPKPPFENPMIVADENSLTVMSTGSTLEEAKAYAASLREAGFTKDVYENSNGIAGITIYTFTAQNQHGVGVSLTFASGTTTANFSKD